MEVEGVRNFSLYLFEAVLRVKSSNSATDTITGCILEKSVQWLVGLVTAGNALVVEYQKVLMKSHNIVVSLVV